MEDKDTLIDMTLCLYVWRGRIESRASDIEDPAKHDRIDRHSDEGADATYDLRYIRAKISSEQPQWTKCLR